MAEQKTASTQTPSPVTKEINVTDLTPIQKREIFIDCLTQAGFSGFIKREVGEQTYYLFTYKN